MKKLETKQESFGSNKGVVLRKNEGSVLQNRFTEFEEKNIFQKESKSEERSSSSASSSYTMVDVSPTSNPKARISFSSFDKSREDYVSQFSEKSRPISEASPIKAQLESIISGKVQGNASLQENKERDVVFTTQSKEDEEKAKKAAVKAMELAFIRRNKAKEEEKRKQEEAQNEEAQNEEAQNEEDSGEENIDRKMDGGIPVPATRKSIKKKDENRQKTEYTEMPRKSELNSSIQIVEFSNSGTDYNNITKANKPN